MLTPHPDLDQSVDHSGCDRLDLAISLNYVPGIGFGLEKTWQNVDVIYGHRTGLVLEADELLVVGGQAVTVVLPPPLLRCVLGERKQEFAPGPGDLVVVEQPCYLAWRQPSLGPLVPAYLGRAPVQRRGNGIPALTFALPDLTQLGREPAAPYRGTAWHGHASSLLRPAGPVRQPSRSRGATFGASALTSVTKPSHTATGRSGNGVTIGLPSSPVSPRPRRDGALLCGDLRRS